MPRLADHAERRSTFADAFVRVLGSVGPAATTFARVAAEASVSVGTLQHYFADGAEMLRFAHERAVARWLHRVEVRVARGERDHESIAVMVLAGLDELLPLDEERAREQVVRAHLRARAQHDPALSAVAATATRELAARVAVAVANGKLCGEVEAAVDEQVAALRLLAVADGLASALAADVAGPPVVAAVLEPVVATVFTGRCRRHDPAERLG